MVQSNAAGVVYVCVDLFFGGWAGVGVGLGFTKDELRDGFPNFEFRVEFVEVEEVVEAEDKDEADF